MTKTRTWSAATAGLCVLLILAAYFLLIAPQRAEAADLRDQTVAQDTANAQTRLKIQQLKAQYAQLPAKQAELAVIKQQLPDNPALPTLVRTLSSMADSAGVTLVSLAPAPPAPFAGTTAAAPAAVVAPGAAPAAGAGTQLLGIATNMVITGDYASSTLFVQKLQAASAAKTGAQLARAFLVQKITVAPLAGATDTSSTSSTTSRAKKGQVQTTLIGQIFVLKTAPIPTVSVPAAGAGSTS